MKVAITAESAPSTEASNVRNRLEQLRAYCGRQGWQIAGEYIDQYSGHKGDRYRRWGCASPVAAPQR